MYFVDVPRDGLKLCVVPLLVCHSPGKIKSIYESVTQLEDVKFLLHFAKDLFPKNPADIDGRTLLRDLQVTFLSLLVLVLPWLCVRRLVTALVANAVPVAVACRCCLSLLTIAVDYRC